MWILGLKGLTVILSQIQSKPFSRYSSESGRWCQGKKKFAQFEVCTVFISVRFLKNFFPTFLIITGVSKFKQCSESKISKVTFYLWVISFLATISMSRHAKAEVQTCSKAMKPNELKVLSSSPNDWWNVSIIF